MDSEDILPVSGLEASLQNGVNGQLPVSESDCGFSDNVNGNVEETFETHLQNELDDNGIIGEAREGMNDMANSNGLIDSKEGEVKDNVKQSKPQKVQAKTKNEKPSGPKNVSSAIVKKSKDGKSAEAGLKASNGGSLAANSRPKQPLQSRSFNEKQGNASKHSEKSDAALSEGTMDKPKLKPLKKGPIHKAEGDTESSSPMAGDGKPHRVGTLPNYGFSFKCDQRAEKRKEFYTKLEEKIQAKEEEKTNLQAKSKETQEAEIKMFRKTLNFKATPMPSFYQEPAPPKVELKKIPPTRAKSPKLGRRKGSIPLDADGPSNGCHQSGRLSLDVKAHQSIPAKVISPVHAKKPQRKSLPKLPSQKTSLSSAEKTPKGSNQKKATASKSTKEENKALSDVANEEPSPIQQQEAVPTADSGESQPNMDQGQMVGEHAELDSVQERIAPEH